MKNVKNIALPILGLTYLCGAALAAPAKKPAAKKPAPTAAKKPAAGGPIVLGTTQLPGDFGQLGTTYTIGKDTPINFTLRSAEYTVAPFVLGNNVWVPGG